MSIRVKSNAKNKRTFIKIDGMTRSASKGLRAALYEIGSESVKHLRRMVRSGDRSGRMYGSHRASAPGEPPAARHNSRLTKGMRYTVRGDFQCEFGDTAPYGGYLEDGTEKMSPRPHISRTVREKRRDIKGIFNRELDPKRMLK